MPPTSHPLQNPFHNTHQPLPCLLNIHTRQLKPFLIQPIPRLIDSPLNLFLPIRTRIHPVQNIVLQIRNIIVEMCACEDAVVMLLIRFCKIFCFHDHALHVVG